MGEPEVVDRARFWSRFDATAPAHLRAAVRFAALWRACGLPLFGPLLLVAKVIACMAYFDDDTNQRRFREPNR